MLLWVLGPLAGLRAAAVDYQIIITTPGYMSIYRYSPEEFSEQMASDFRVEGAAIAHDRLTDDRSRVTLYIGTREFVFTIAPESRVCRLTYDRNKRQFKGVGFNYVDSSGVRCEAPSFKGTPIFRLPELWQPQIEKLIGDRNLLVEDKPNVFILEADIDEQGIVHKIVELNGALKQYSQIFIDKIYDLAVRGWEPAKKNGVPIRTVAQIRFELYRDKD